ncbi:MAG: maleylpyruvate isomerase family mycothiol-dependent enzyme [Actinobacteria bacterium]|nr:maleylpyruvate isomerase family mycothiol-dependent enzyme [Actinomycetota bacterium]
MALPRETVSKGFVQELEDFSTLLRSLDEKEWNTPSRCDGWTVANVAGHVTGQLTDVTTGKLDDLGTPGVTQRQVDERKGRSADEVADEVDAGRKVGTDMVATFDDDAWNGPVPAPNVAGTLGDGVEALWYDTYLHADDIRSAIGRKSERGPGLEAGISHIATILGQKEWGAATLALDGIAEFPVGGSGGKRITGDPFEFMLAATGRGDPARFGLDETVNIYR